MKEQHETSREYLFREVERRFGVDRDRRSQIISETGEDFGRNFPCWKSMKKGEIYWNLFWDLFDELDTALLETADEHTEYEAEKRYYFGHPDNYIMEDFQRRYKEETKGGNTLRKRLMASIGAYLRLEGTELEDKKKNEDRIKGTACRAAHRRDFNGIENSLLNKLIRDFNGKQRMLLRQQGVKTQIR